MRKPTRKPVTDTSRWLPPCEQAQADGVPCTEVGRDCEICERAYPRDPRDRPPPGLKSDGPLPTSGA